MKEIHMLTKERQGELALAIVKSKIRDEGIRIGPHVQREIPKKAKDLGIPTTELLEFFELLTRELVDETFKK